MASSVECPACGCWFPREQVSAADTLTCIWCQHRFRPGSGAAAAPPSAPPAKVAAREVSAPDGAGYLRLTCGHCGKQLKVNERHAGHQVQCACGGSVDVPFAAASKAAAPSERELQLQDDAGDRCESCHAPIWPLAVVCVKCGYDRRSGTHLATHSESQERDFVRPLRDGADKYQPTIGGGNPYASPGDGGYATPTRSFRRNQQDQPTWDAEASLSNYIDTTKSILFSPVSTFSNFRLEDNWTAPVWYASANFALAWSLTALFF
ncbi:MAG: hypothetical protein KDA41_08095, partial [Planctomycetales bacterium]|nr:hypothetical protein [Planctomycetales bacterium]